jgi:hypothetical protein
MTIDTASFDSFDTASFDATICIWFFFQINLNTLVPLPKIFSLDTLVPLQSQSRHAAALCTLNILWAVVTFCRLSGQSVICHSVAVVTTISRLYASPCPRSLCSC